MLRAIKQRLCWSVVYGLVLYCERQVSINTTHAIFKGDYTGKELDFLIHYDLSATTMESRLAYSNLLNEGHGYQDSSPSTLMLKYRETDPPAPMNSHLIPSSADPSPSQF